MTNARTIARRSRQGPGRSAPPPAAPSTPAPPTAARERSLHVRFGWWSLLVFLSLGAILELLHALKVGLYLDVANETRRLLWTLAHAHGTLLSLVHIAFGLSLPLAAGLAERSRRLASRCLLGATILLPAGFFLGGAFIHGGDPGLGVLLVPVGFVLLVTAVVLTARGLSR